MRMLLRWLFATREFKAAVKAAIEDMRVDAGEI